MLPSKRAQKKTPEHPFYIADNAWVAAGELWLGARVKKADGGYGTVKAISVLHKPQVMYNLTVEGAHTFYVGDEGWLVHNACRSRGRRQVDRFERYGSEAEARATEQEGGLVPRPGHERQPKWIADLGQIPKQGKNLGQTKNYTHQIEIETQAGTRDWAKQFEIKPRVEPGRYAIPGNKLDEFNKRIISIKIKRVR